jgi:hypothetical protein
MATRRPLYYDSGNLREMSETQINEIITQVSYQYSLNPSIVLNVSTSGGTLSGLPLIDTRKTAGAYKTFATRFPTEGETDEPGTVTVNYSRLTQATNGFIGPYTTVGPYPIFNDGGNLKPMSATDIFDTFIYPAIDNLASGSTGVNQAGTYRIHNATTLAGHTLVSSTAIFKDTRADTTRYTANAIPETLDQPKTIANYYLFKVNGSNVDYAKPVYVRNDGDLQTFSNSQFDTILQRFVRYATVNITGYTLSYNINGTGNNRGSGMTDTTLNGPGTDDTTRYVNANDYRRQEFPNGSAVTTSTYYLRINQS